MKSITIKPNYLKALPCGANTVLFSVRETAGGAGRQLGIAGQFCAGLGFAY